MMRMHNLKPNAGAKHRRKRLGAGESSGTGKTSGKGHKGQKARSGGSIRPGFEGGQMPLIRRLPKKGFNNATHAKRYLIVNVGQLNRFEDGAQVDEGVLREAGVIRGSAVGVKVLGTGTLEKKITLTVDKATESARQKIEAAGGTLQLAGA